MPPERCKQCGSENFKYLGLDDGGGEYGDSITADYKCLSCGYIVEVVMHDDDDEEEPPGWDYSFYWLAGFPLT